MKRFFKLNDTGDTGKGYSELSRKEFSDYQKTGEHFFVNLGYALMETSEAEYRKFRKVRERRKYVKQLEAYYGVFSYHGLQGEDGDIDGEELLHDESVNVEETAIEAVFLETMFPKLPKAIATLTADDRKLVHYLFGEILALSWDSINLENKSITVKCSVSRIKDPDTGKTELLFAEPKTKAGRCTVPIVDSLIPVLQAHKER